MTTTQRARLTALGWDDNLAVETNGDGIGTPKGDNVTVEVEACGVCYRDCIDRNGGFKFIQLPVTPGHEAVGRVIAVGPEVTDWAVGDRVATMHRDFCGTCSACQEGNTALCQAGMALLGLVIDGGYATHLSVPQRCLYRTSDDLPAADAAVLHCTFGVAYHGLKYLGRMEAGQHVLVTGANGGVGTAAVQVARRLGAHVTAVVRDERHRDMLTTLGADEIVVNAGDSFHKALSRVADVVLDCVGPPTFNAALRSLRPGGRMVVIGNVVQEAVSVNLGLLVTKGLQLAGSAGATRTDMEEVLALHAADPFKIQIHERVPLADADRAQRLVQAGGLQGRVVIVPAAG